MAEIINASTDVLGGSVIRYNLNTTTPNQAVIRKIIAGNGISITSTGVDAGTGDVTISIDTTGTGGSGGGTGGSGGGTPTAVGTVTSVNLTVPTGLTVSGAPITTAGTLMIQLASGYSIPLESDVAKGVTAWNTLPLKADNAGVVHIFGAETITGSKTFTASTYLRTTYIGSSGDSYGAIAAEIYGSNQTLPFLRVRGDGSIQYLADGTNVQWTLGGRATGYAYMYAPNGWFINPFGGNVIIGATGEVSSYRFQVDGGLYHGGRFTISNAINGYKVLSLLTGLVDVTFGSAGMSMISPTTNYGNTQIDITRGKSDYFGGIRLNAYNGSTRSSTIPDWLIGVNPIYGIGPAHDFSIWTYDGTIYSSHFYVTANGNIIIGGYNNAGYKLDVIGDARIQTIANETVDPDKILVSSSGVVKYMTKSQLGLGSGANIYNSNGTLTGNRTVTSGGYSLTFTGTNTASAAVAKGLSLTYTLVAAANNDVLVGLDILPTYTNGAYTGVANVDLRVGGTNLVFGSSVGFGANYGYTNDGIIQIKTLAPYKTQMWFRPAGNASGYNSNYWSRIEHDAANLAIYGANYGTLTLMTNNGGGNSGKIVFTGNTGALNNAVTIEGAANAGRIAFINYGSSPFTFNGGNVLINTTTDSSYNLDVAGTGRFTGTLNLNTLASGVSLLDAIVISSTDNGNYARISFGDGNNALLRWSNRMRLQEYSGNFDLYQTGSGGRQIGLFTPLGHTYYAYSAVTTGTATYNIIASSPTINNTGGTTVIRGFYYNPTLTSVTGTTQYAFESTAGKIKISDLSGTGDRFVIVDSTGTMATATIGSGLSYSGGVLTATGGAAGTVTGSGTAGKIVKFNSASDIGNSIMTETTNMITVAGSVTATSFIKSGGTSSQFLKADGSVDTTVYLASGSFISDYDSAITGLRNSSNKVYTLTQNFQSGTTKVYVNGVRYSPGGSNDYVETGTNQITFTNAPDNGDLLLVDYIKA